MLTSTQITAGAATLSSGKLTSDQIEKLIPVMRMFLADLEEKYSYDFEGKLEALNDTTTPGKKAAQVAACIIEMESLGFGVARLDDRVKYEEKNDYLQYVVICLAQLYPIPKELAVWYKRRYDNAARYAQTVRTERAPYTGIDW